MKKAVIHIIDRHISAGEEYVCELTTSGEFEITENGCTVAYTETDEELADCLTTLNIEGSDRILMTRTGKYNTEMILEKERRHSCYYSTPYGDLVMGIYAKSIANSIGENGGCVKFAYAIDFNNEPASENELTVTIKIQEEE